MIHTLPQTALTVAQIDLTGLAQGTALVVVGLLAVLLWAIIQTNNRAAMVMWGLSVLTLLVSFIFGINDELFWFALITTVVLLVVGVTARVAR